MQKLGFEGTFYVPKDFKFKKSNTKTSTTVKIDNKVYKGTLEYYNYFEEENLFEGVLYINLSNKVFDNLLEESFKEVIAPNIVEVNGFNVKFDCTSFLY